MPETLQRNYYPALDGMRGIAILMVLLAHLGLNRYLWKIKFYLVSNTGVSIFFVLSGFLITTLLLKELLKTGEISLKRFYIRRTLRILPLAYLFLLVLLLLDQVFNLNVKAVDFIASFLFFKNFPMQNEPYTAHFWSLAVEEQFYITFPILLATNINRYTLVAVLTVLIVPAISILSYLGLNLLHNNSTGILLSKLCMYAFWKGPVMILTGSVCSILMFKGILRPEKFKINFLLGFVLFVLGVEVTAVNFPYYTKYVSESISTLLICASIVLSMDEYSLLHRLLKNAVLNRIGILSYSIYIWQELFIGTGAWQPWLHPLSGNPLWLIMLFKLTILAAIVPLSFSYEALFLRIKDRYKINNSHNDQQSHST
jgi:peptidoglycan/LPS O-acetylase OafA/YrhL